MANKKSNSGEAFTPLFTRFLRYEFPQPICGKRKKLKLLEVAIYGEFASFHRQGKKIYPTIGYLAEKFGVSNPTIIEAIDALVAAGLISKTSRFNKSNVYNVIITPEQFGKLCDAQGIVNTEPEEQEDLPPKQAESHKEEETTQADAPDVQRKNNAREIPEWLEGWDTD